MRVVLELYEVDELGEMGLAQGFQGMDPALLRQKSLEQRIEARGLSRGLCVPGALLGALEPQLVAENAYPGLVRGSRRSG